MRILVGLCILVMASTTALPKERLAKPIQAALNNFVYDAFYCVAFFRFAQDAVALRPDTDRSSPIVKELSRRADRSLSLGLWAADKVGLNKRGVLARVKFVNEDVLRKTNANRANLAALMVEYKKPCKSITDHPERRVLHLLNKEM